MIKKAQSTTEFIIVILFFIIITIILLTSYLRIFPSETAKIKEQIACSQAEAFAFQFLELEGNETNWHSGGDLYALGFATETAMEINYSKIKTAKERGYYNITTDANLTIPFRLSYTAYAINFSNENIPILLPNDSAAPSVFLVSNTNVDGTDSLLVYAGTNSSTETEFSMTLFFPYADISESNCTTGPLEAGDTNTTTEEMESNKSILKWSVGAQDLDCINFTMTTTPSLIFIKEMSLKSSTAGQDYYIYLYNHTILNNKFGSSGDIDKEKSYCEIERAGIIIQDDDEDERIPVKFKITSWR